jgi:hypothetical protein
MKEPSTSHDEIHTMDPRRKDSQGLDFWAEGLLRNRLITRKEYEDFLRENSSKEEAMLKRNLPQLRHYGIFNSTNEIKEKIKTESGDKFIIRCTSKENGDIKRLVDANLVEVCDFADNLPGGFENWNVEVKEFTETQAAGTIIVSPSGRTSIETWHGPHYLNTTNIPKYHADFDPEQFHMHYQWRAPEGVDDLEEIQRYAIKALRYIFRNLKPKENEPIYVEYGVKTNGEVYFIEANSSPLLTGK